MDSSDDLIPRQLKKLMKDRGWKIIQLAAATGIPKRTLESYTSGRQKPSYDAIKAICVGTGISPSDLFFGEATSEKHILNTAIITFVGIEVMKSAIRHALRLSENNVSNEVILSKIPMVYFRSLTALDLELSGGEESEGKIREIFEQYDIEIPEDFPSVKGYMEAALGVLPGPE